MEAIDAARLYHDWAVTGGLLNDSSIAVTTNPGWYALLSGVSDEGIAFLRHRRILAIGFNSADRELTVFTKLAAPSSKRALARLPANVDDVRVVYRQGVNTPIGNVPASPHGTPPYTVRTNGNGQHYTCGSSISVGNFRDAGTMSCLVRNDQGVLHGLSNNHVSGACSFADLDMPIVAPGIADVAPGNLSPFTIGFHSKTLPLKAGAPGVIQVADNSDAAIFRIAKEELVSSFQGTFYDTPLTVADFVAGLIVEKVGRTTGLTSGVVMSQIFGPFGIAYSAPLYGFSSTIYYDPMFAIIGNANVFSDAGDSGSLITTVDANGDRHAVGIVVGSLADSKAPGQKITLALPIGPILETLGVTLVSGHNV